MKTIIKIFCLLFFTSSWLFPQAGEFVLKSAYLEKFAVFTDWPSYLKMDNPEINFIIGVYGDHKITEVLKKFYKTQKIRNKNVLIKQIQSSSDYYACNIIFITNEGKGNLSSIIEFTNDKPILTVGDTEGFAKNGVLINFYIKDEKLRFEVNETSVKKAGLSLSYHLLKYAKIITTD